MAPKKDTKDVIFLKLKRQSSAYFVTISKGETVLQLKNLLVAMINQTGGLRITDKPIPINDVMDIMNDSYLEVPEIGLNDSSDSETNSNTNEENENKNSTGSAQTELSDPNLVKVDVKDITLGMFEDQINIYTTQPTELEIDDTAKIESLSLQDFNIIPFRYKDEKFEIFKPLD